MASVALVPRDSIADQLEQLHQRIAQRAYQLFGGRGTLWGDPWADWFAAERQLIWKPAVELREKDGTFTMMAALAGVDPKDVQVDVTPRDVAIKAEISHRHEKEEGQVHQCEFMAGQVFRSVRFPKPVDVANAKAEYRNGMLTITAPVAPEAQAKRVEIKAV